MTEIEVSTKLENHEMRIVRNEERVNKLENVYNELKDLTLSVNSLSLSIQNLVNEQKTISNRLTVIEQEPADKYKLLTKQIIIVAVSAIGGAIISAIINLI